VRKRKANDTGNAIAGLQPASRNTYEQLEARTKHIPQELIDTWPQVSPQILEQVVAVLRDAKKDIANAQRDERKVIAAHDTLNPLVKKLSRLLASSRIPPQAKDIHFNIGKLTERNTQVSREATTARHAKQLLTEQANIARNLLHQDEKNLEQLKRNTKKWRAEWKHQEKRGRVSTTMPIARLTVHRSDPFQIHPFLQDEEDKGGTSDGPDDINLQPSAPPELSLLETADTELGPVLTQLRRSLENMQGNHAQVRGIDEAIRQTQAALDDVLSKHASASQYAAL